MALFDLTAAQLALFSSCVVLAGGGAYGIFWKYSSTPAWAPVYTDAVFKKKLPDFSYGKRYSQLLVHPEGGENFYGSSINNKFWWDRKFALVKDDLENESHEIFRNVKVAFYYPDTLSLSQACEQIYHKIDPLVVQHTEPNEDETAMWKYCSPLGYRPMNLQQAEEYQEYCESDRSETESASKGFCISKDGGKDEAYRLASTGTLKLTWLHREAQNDPSNKEKQEASKKLPKEANPIFWAIKDQWFKWMDYYHGVYVNKAFSEHVERKKKQVNYNTITLREICEEAYLYKKWTDDDKQLVPANVMVEYCGIAESWRPQSDYTDWKPESQPFNTLPMFV